MDKTRIRGKVARIMTDPTQYKPYSPDIEFHDLWVDFWVPTENVTTIKDGFSLGLNDFALYILKPMAQAIDDMNITTQKEQAAKDATPQRRK